MKNPDFRKTDSGSEFLPHMRQHIEDAVKAAPDNKSPACAVPDTTNQKDNEYVAIGAESSLTVSAQRDVDIAGKKSAQCNMPSVPKFNDTLRFVGGEKVDRNLNIEHTADTARHIAIAAEVEVELKGVEQDHQEGLEAAQGNIICKAPVSRFSKGIRQKHLLGKT